MQNIKIKDVVNPRNSDPGEEKILYFPGDTNLYSINKEDIPEDVVYLGMMDDEGVCSGTISAERIRKVLDMYCRIPTDGILDELHEAVVAVNMDGIIFYANEAYEEILNVPIGKILGKDLHIIESGASLLNVLQTGQSIEMDKLYVKNAQRYVSVRMFPLMSNENVMIGAASVFRDKTELSRLNKELEDTARVAEEYSREIVARDILKEKNIIGESKSFVGSVSKAIMAANSDVTVMLRGENGSGKEVFARLIHQNSLRKDKPMITTNCAAIPENLIESELFGYEHGAFTGARKEGQMGKFELADGGTIFLDEIGDIPLSVQAKLLRVLQDGEIEKIGRQRPVKVDVRIIAATNRPLEKMLEEGLFREDLFYRLNVLPIKVPPLRERGNDIVLLARYFTENYGEKYHKRVKLSEEVYKLLVKYDWPGNVRELQNVIESSVVLCSGELIRPEDLPENFLSSVESKEARDSYGGISEWPDRMDVAVSMCERNVILQALKKCGGKRQKTIDMLGISRRTFYRKVKELNIPLDVDE